MGGPAPLPRYQHTQPAHTIRISVFAGMALLAGMAVAFAQGGHRAEPVVAILLTTVAVLAVAVVLFWSLTVTVSETSLAWHFGPGLIRMSVALDDIVSCTPTRTPLLAGWGIHWMPRGWVYNASGFGAVEVRLKSGKALRIGTDEPAALAEAVRTATGRPVHTQHRV